MIVLKFLILGLALGEFIDLTQANEVIGCGGFIKSNTEINYRIIKVKLLTEDKMVKYTTEASPVNGYYMIPIYTKGKYILQVNPPPGWSFEPTEISINVDGESDACTKNEDINFFFKGFGLSGKVVTHGDTRMNGPSGIKLNLISDNKAIDSALSGPDGIYYFSNVMPGAYQIEAQHESIEFLTKKVSVVLSKENWSAKENIVVLGYKIEGRVLTSNGNPVPNAIVSLHYNDESQSKIDTKRFVCDLSSKSNLQICHVKTDSNGKFSFLNVEFGKYKLSSSLNMENSKFRFSMKPDSLTVDLTTHQDALVSESFKVDKVTVQSQALLAKDGRPIDNGQVYINGQKLAQDIGKDGKFYFTLSSGSYKIQVKSDKAYFHESSFVLDLSKYSNLEASSSHFQKLKTMTSFVVKSFDVCGQVSVLKDQNIDNLYKSIKINAYGADNMKLIKTASLGVDLQYCMSLDTEKNYVLKAELIDSKLAKVLKLVPLEKKISVVDKPILNINFGQLEAKLDAKVMLLQNSQQHILNDLVVTIKSEDSNQKWSKDVNVKCEKYGSGSVCKFSLTNLLFGDYLISTNYDDLFCWKNKKKLTIDSENQVFELNQSGFLLNYQFSHKNAVVKIDTIVKNIQTNNDLKGVFCLPKAIDYDLTIESCHRYTDNAGETDLIKLDQDFFKKDANKVHLKASKVQVDFEVLFKNDQSAQDIKSEDLFIEAVDQENKVEKINFKIKSKTSNEMVFTAKGWFMPNQRVSFKAKSNKILFEENSKSLKVNEENCKLNMIKFEAKLGIFITGNVKPNDLEKIELVLSTADEKTVLEKSLVKGSFRLGPLKAPYSLYNVELSKNGYLFTKKLIDSKNPGIAEYEFIAEKLGQLKVNVVDKKHGAQLENVLLSLSSENRQFRQNYKTDSNGEMLFENLKPGLYYLIVMMQEYEFTPNSHPIRISDGDHTSIKITAERIAYSCLGKVTSINGQAENNIQIEAVGLYNTANSDADSCAQSQESATIEHGIYHIYNLKPKCEYTLKLKNNKIEKSIGSRVIPESYDFIVGESDVTDKNFILLDSDKKCDVSLAVSFKAFNRQVASPINHYVKVKLFKMDQPDSIIQTQYAPANSIIYFNHLSRNPAQQYSVHVSLLASTVQYSFTTLTQQQQTQLAQLPVIESMELGFYSDSTHKHLKAKFDLDKRTQEYFDNEHGQQQYQNVYMTLPLFIVIVGILLNSKSVQKQLSSFKNYVEQNGGLMKAAQSSFQSPANRNSPKSPRSGRSKNNNHKKQLNTDSSANESDLERTAKYAARQQTMTGEYTINSNKYEIDNYDIIDNEDVMDMQLPARKQRVKKVD